MVYESIESNFFIIESDNLQDVESNFYGYCIADNQIKFPVNGSESVEFSGDASYVSVINDSEIISISQDFMGSYALYLFEYDDYFAISNSFLMLEEFLKEKFALSFNEEFAESLICADIASYSFDDTLIREIKVLPKNCKVLINISEKKIEYEFIDYSEVSIDICSQEAVNIIDAWFNKWVCIVRNLSQEYTVSIDLFDDFSSLALLSLLLNANIDLQSLDIRTNNFSTESLELFSGIGEDLNLSLDNITYIQSNVSDIRIPLELSFYSKLGFQKQYDYSCNIHDEHLISINNRDMYYYNTNPILNIEEYMESTVNNAKNYSLEFAESIEKYLWENIHKIQKHCKSYDINTQEFCQQYYYNTVFRNQFAKNNVEDYLANKINLNPLMDTQLQKLKVNRNLLARIIIQRYAPELLKYNENQFNEEELEVSRQINENHPLEKVSYELLKAPQNKTGPQSSIPDPVDLKEIHDFITKVFYSNSFKHTFLRYFSEEVYNNVINFHLERNNHFYAEIYAIISIVKIIQDTEYSQYRNISSEMDWLKTHITLDNGDENIILPIQGMLTKYHTARIDIKNRGTYTNQVKILDISDNSAQITMPAWFTNEKGEGKCINSNEGELSFKLKCIGDGDLNIELRTVDVRDRHDKRFPVYIDYLNFKIDNHEYLKENTLAWHNDPVKFHKKVLDGEIVKVYIRWQPFTKISKYDG